MDSPHELSINDILAGMGYGHRKLSDNHIVHEIFQIATGRVIGSYGAGEAIKAALEDQKAQTNQRRDAHA